VESTRLRLFPLNTVLFPGAALNLHVFEPRYKQMISECIEGGEPFGVALIREGGEAGDPGVLAHRIGTTAEIDDVTALEHGRYYINTVGRRRFRIERVLSREPYLLADVTYLDDETLDDDSAIAHRVEEIRAMFREYLGLLVDFSGLTAEIALPEDPIDASFMIGDALQVSDAMKQRLLEIERTEDRLIAELGFLKRLLPQLRALLERKREQAVPEPATRRPETARDSQEKFFGKHFSLN